MNQHRILGSRQGARLKDVCSLIAAKVLNEVQADLGAETLIIELPVDTEQLADCVPDNQPLQLVGDTYADDTDHEPGGH